MKFALLALIATASAIKVTAPPACKVSRAMSDEVYGTMNGGSGEVNEKELMKGLKGSGIAEKDQAKIANAAGNFVGKDGKLDKKEFNELLNNQAAALGIPC